MKPTRAEVLNHCEIAYWDCAREAHLIAKAANALPHGFLRQLLWRDVVNHARAARFYRKKPKALPLP